MEINRYNLNNGIKWKDIIDFKTIISKNFVKDYESDYESDDNNEDVELNTINFSLDNEKILNEIEKILNIKNFDNYTSLELLKSQDLVASYLSKSIVQNNNRSFEFFNKKT